MTAILETLHLDGFAWDASVVLVFVGILALLTVATAIGLALRLLLKRPEQVAFISHVNKRIKAWWIMVAVFSAAVATGGTASILLFAATSALALWEFRRVAGIEIADNRTWAWLFLVVLPIHYYLLVIHWYGLFCIFIPVYGFLFIPTRSVLRDQTEQFLERVATIQWGLMICVYCLSHAPALMMLEGDGLGGPALLMFLVTIAELGDVAQFVWGKSFGRTKIAPRVSPNKTYEGFFGGVLTAGVVGMILSPITPFTLGESFGLGLAIGVVGFLGDVTLSAVKRSRQVKDYGSILPGHGGVLDRIDSLCFAAPLFFHYVRYYYAA